MNRKMASRSTLFFLAIAFLAFSAMNNVLFSNARIDLTENSLYTLSDGSKKIIESIEEPLNLYFFFSEKTSKDLTSLRAYAVRVRELLEEYALEGGDRIRLKVIDPEPFSDEEDMAAEFGLQSVPVSTAGDELYFGLAATNAVDDVEIIPFFQPDKEEFLEYDISKLIQNLVRAEKPVAGLLSTIEVQGDIDMTTFQSTPPWVIVQQMEQLFNLRKIESGEESIPEDIDILVLIHPKGLSEKLLFSIDQFLMKGGKMLAFVDPLAEMDRPARPDPMNQLSGAGRSSDLNKLTSSWGIRLMENKVLGDSQTALSVSGSGGTPVRHLAIVGMGPQNLSADDVVTAELETVNLATAGMFVIDAESKSDITTLIQSSEYAMPLDSFQFQFLSDPNDLKKGFVPSGERYPVAVRVSGSAVSSFPDGMDGYEGEVVTETDNLNVILVADTDILSDRLWVQVQNFFGQKIASPWADNGDFVINALDNLSGSSALISIRSRGRFTRPFDVVQDIKREAEARYLESANALQAQLAETEQKLNELQSGAGRDGLLTLNPEQQAALEKFQTEKLKIRKQLRDVQHELNDDIESLGATLKFLNIALIPLLLTLMLLALNYLRVSRGRDGE